MNHSEAKILIVDDARSVRLILSAILKAEGYRVVAAGNGAEALEKVIADSTINLIVSDINMPVMGGIDLVKELRKQGLDVPIMMVSDVNDISVVVEALNSGASDYVLKDANIEKTVVFTVNKTLERHRLVQKNQQLEQRVELEVRKNREKDVLLLQQDKLASIGQLAAGVAHEINNPLGFITSNLGTLKGYAENLTQFTTLLQTTIDQQCSDEERRIVDEASQRLDIAYILHDIISLIIESSEGAERVKRIVMDLKDFARADEKGFSPADLNKCIKSSLNIVHNELKNVADVVLRLEPLPMVVCSAGQINQVIANLLVNAGHSIEKHGTITVNSRQEGERAIIAISDTGCGMTEDVRKRIFEPFYTTKEVGKGTGLGLTISYDIIKKHGGNISVESEPGRGTTFTVRLPINRQEEMA